MLLAHFAAPSPTEGVRRPLLGTTPLSTEERLLRHPAFTSSNPFCGRCRPDRIGYTAAPHWRDALASAIDSGALAKRDRPADPKVRLRPNADIETLQEELSRPLRGKRRGHIGETAGVRVFVGLFTGQGRPKLSNNHRVAGYVPTPRSDV